jgi:chromate transporter
MDRNEKNIKAGLSELFFTFLKLGAFTIGGGYAMIPLIEKELIDKKSWFDREEFLELLALAQSAPGIIAMNIAVSVGYKAKGKPGMYMASLGAVLPSFVIILLIAAVFTSFRDNPTVESIFKGIRPAVVALIAAPLFRLAKSAHITLKTMFIPIGTAILVGFLGVSPILIILSGAVGGILWFLIAKRKQS